MDNQKLVEFLQGTQWNDYIEDETVKDLATKLTTRVSELKKPTVDVSGASRVKLVVVGDGAVGKTSLLITYSKGEFPTEYLPTVFENYTAQIQSKDFGLVLLHLWDTAGQEDYDRLRPLSYPGTDIVLLCFSTISQSSCDAVKEKWAPEVHHYIPDVPKFLIGTKIDLREAKATDPNTGKYDPVNPEKGQALAKELGALKYLEVSSKTGKGLNEIFNAAISLVLSERDGGSSSGKSGSKKAKKKEGCLLL